MKRIVVDPVNRIEGHLRVEVQVDEATGKVSDALSSGTAWRGIEVICKDRDPRDIWAFVGRICGVCTSTHSLSCLRAVEDALGIEVPKNANYIRNIMLGTQSVHDHVVHFYHLHALDWVSPVSALKADPAAAAALQNTMLDKYAVPLKGPIVNETQAYPKTFPKATNAYFRAIQDKVRKIVESGQLGIFAAHYWDHPDYNILPPEVHLIGVAHYLEMLDKQREFILSHVVFGGKNPHPHYIVGGMPCSISLDDMNAPVNTERLMVVEKSLHSVLDACNFYYLPDVLAIGEFYVKAGMLDGGGLAGVRALSVGDMPDGTFKSVSNGSFHKNLLLRSEGVVENFSAGLAAATFSTLEPKDYADPSVIAEGVAHSWYEYPAGKSELHPWDGVSQPKYTAPKEGTKTNWKYLDEQGKYSWVKTPKWRGKMAEVGPLAKYIVIYVKVKKGIITEPTWLEKMMVDQIDFVSKVLGVAPEKWLPTTLGRTAARALDAQANAYVAKYFQDKLLANIKSGDTIVANTEKWDPSTWPKEAKGVGLVEAPRGALSHWIVIKDGKVANYQAVVPSTWNAAPRDDAAGHGPYEASMIDTKVKIPDKPLEILRVIHSFDPCLACATHLYDTKGKEVAVVRCGEC